MHRGLPWIHGVCWVVALGLLASSASIDTAAAKPEPTPFESAHPALRSSLQRIAAGSRLWRDAMGLLDGTGRRAVLVTPDQVRVQDRGEGGRRRGFDPGVVAEVAPVPTEDSRVQEVLVVVNLPLLQRAYHERPNASYDEWTRDLDRIVIHEVYGHAVPYLVAGSLSGRCPDPMPGQAAEDACAIRRENAVREELGLGRRLDAGLAGLALIGRDSSARWGQRLH